MYNEERKRKFINSLTNKADLNYITKIFDASVPYENDEKIDLCEFDKESVIHLLTDMEIVQFTTIEMQAFMIRKYQKWCMSNGFTEVREPIKLTITEMKSCLKELPEIISYEELQRNENLLLNICDQLILESIYLGIRGKRYCELLNMSEREIDPIHKTIKLCTGRVIKVNDRFITLCRTSAVCYEYYLLDGRKQMLVGKLPIKLNAQVKINDANDAMIHDRLKRFKKIPDFKANLGTTMLFDSGFVNTCKDAMSEMEISDFAEFLGTDRGMEIYNQYGMPKANKSRKIYKYQGYFE